MSTTVWEATNRARQSLATARKTWLRTVVGFRNSCEIIEIIATESHPIHEQRSMDACREARLPFFGNPVINQKGVAGQLYKDFFSLSAFFRPNRKNSLYCMSGSDRDPGAREKDHRLGPAQSSSSSLQIAHWTHLSPAAKTPLQ